MHDRRFWSDWPFPLVRPRRFHAPANPARTLDDAGALALVPPRPSDAGTWRFRNAPRVASGFGSPCAPTPPPLVGDSSADPAAAGAGLAVGVVSVLAAFSRAVMGSAIDVAVAAQTNRQGARRRIRSAQVRGPPRQQTYELGSGRQERRQRWRARCARAAAVRHSPPPSAERAAWSAPARAAARAPRRS